MIVTTNRHHGPQRAESLPELVMRFSPAALALATLAAVTASPGLSAAPDSGPAKPLSVLLASEGARAQAAGRLDAANDLFESALAADPRNAAAYVALGDVARAQKLEGKAVRFYRDAQLIDPANRPALLGEGLALAQRGAVAQAKAVQARLVSLCGNGCTETAALSDAIDGAAARPARSATAVTPTIVTERGVTEGAAPSQP